MAELTQEEIDALLNGGASAPAAEMRMSSEVSSFSRWDVVMLVTFYFCCNMPDN